MIQITHLTIRSDAFELKDVCMEIPNNRYAMLMGPTGCGKTSLLEAICGLRPVSAGAILLDGRDVTRLRPAQRGVGYVPQDRALFATMSVRENLGFALNIRRWSPSAIRERAQELAKLLRIEHLLERMPDGLSGGEAQRVALGRALAVYPQILCLDEPLNALDADICGEMCDLLKTVQVQTGVTVLHVTHDRQEVQRLASLTFQFVDGIVRMNLCAGRFSR